MKKKVSKEILCETAFRLYVLRDRSQTCPFLFFLSLPPLGADSPCQGEMSRRDSGYRDRCPSAHTGADEGAGSRPLSCRGAHCAPAVFNPNSAVGAGPRPARRPFCRARPPGRAARVYHVSAVGAAHWAARIYQQAHSALIPNICIQTSHKGRNSSLFEQTQSLPLIRLACGQPPSPRRRLNEKEEFYLWQPIKQPIIN